MDFAKVAVIVLLTNKRRNIIKIKFKKHMLSAVHKDANHDYVINNLLKDFEENSVDCMPIKGFVIKNYYPSAEMRTMGDIDILIRPAEYKKIHINKL